MMRTCLIAAVGVAFVGGGAARADVALVKGGAKGDGRALVATALADAERAMAVCWRGTPPASVRVAVSVAAGGVVTARPVSKGGAAQCAAGILAVWTLPGGAWSGELEITPGPGGGGAGGGDLSATIQQQLLGKSATIRACQSAAPGASGAATIKMKVHPDGTITDVAVASKLGAALDACVTRAVGKLRLDPIDAPGPVRYKLAVAFAGGTGGEAGPAEAPPGGPDDGSGGAVGGSLSASQVRDGIGKARSAVGKCAQTGTSKGTVRLRFTIRPDGTTKNIVVKEGIGDASLEACLSKVVAGLRFPSSSGETKVSYPFVVSR